MNFVFLLLVGFLAFAAAQEENVQEEQERPLMDTIKGMMKDHPAVRGRFKNFVKGLKGFVANRDSEDSEVTTEDATTEDTDFTNHQEATTDVYNDGEGTTEDSDY